MGFRTPQEATAHYKKLRNSAERPGVPHGDLCPKLVLHGVEWAIPARGVRVVPQFGPDGVTVEPPGDGGWPDAARLLELASVTTEKRCEVCGQTLESSLEVDVAGNLDFLTLCFTLAGKLLDARYELSPEQKSDLLAFDTDAVPLWIPQLLQWASAEPRPTPDVSGEIDGA